jgi:hypothetical protein
MSIIPDIQDDIDNAVSYLDDATSYVNEVTSQSQFADDYISNARVTIEQVNGRLSELEAINENEVIKLAHERAISWHLQQIESLNLG